MNDDRKGRGKELAAAVLKYVILISWALTTIIPLLWVFVNSFKTSEEIVKKWRGTAFRHSVQQLQDNHELSGFKYVQSVSEQLYYFRFRGSRSGACGRISGVCAGKIPFSMDEIRGCSSYCLPPGSLLCNHDSQLCNDQQASDQRNSCGGHYPSDCGKSLLSITLLTGFMRSLPDELDEAAIMDGATPIYVFSRITMPLVQTDVLDSRNHGIHLVL